MIYRKWSLVTGPAAMAGGIVAVLAAANLVLFKEDPFLKAEPRKHDPNLRA